MGLYGGYTGFQTLNGAKVVIDHATGLMWQQSGSSSNDITWENAQDYVKQLNKKRFAGFSDWRLPTIEELASLLEPRKNWNLYIDPVFDAAQWWCWSADQIKGSSAAWIVYFSFGFVLGHTLYGHPWVRAVRSRQ